MKELVTTAMVLTLASATASATCVGYTVQSNGDDNLYTIDLTTGVATRVGPVGYGDVEGLGFDVDGTLYGVEGTGGHVIRIDTATGQGTLVGTVAFTGLDSGAAIDQDTGRLFAISGGPGSSLYAIDKTTGSATLVATYSVYADALAIGPGSIAYVVDAIETDSLYRIDLAAPTNIHLVGPLGIDVLDQAGLARCPLTNRYYLLLEDGFLYTVDVTTGHASFIAQTLPDFEGLAIIPEPATVSLLALGGLALIRRRRGGPSLGLDHGRATRGGTW